MEIKVQTDDLMTVPEAARRLGRPKLTLYRWIEKDRLIALKFGDLRLVPVCEIERVKRLDAKEGCRVTGPALLKQV